MPTCTLNSALTVNTKLFFSFLCSNHYFKYIKISALALLKMVMHARSGGNLEIMGMLLGKVCIENNYVINYYIDVYILCIEFDFIQGCSYSGRRQAAEPTTDVRSPALSNDFNAGFQNYAVLSKLGLI